jgi:hypothetical protein
MLPTVCNSKEFVYCTDHEAKQHASNPAITSALCDAVRSWLSHAADVLAKVDQAYATFDDGNPMSPFAVFDRLVSLQRDLNFVEHFSRDEVLAVKRVLLHHDQSKDLLSQLAASEQTLMNHNMVVAETCESLGLVAACELPVEPHELCEVIPVTFSGLRAVWFCSRAFGRNGAQRFAALHQWINDRACELISESGSIAQQVERGTISAARGRSNLVDAQRCIVALEAANCELLEAIVRESAIPARLRPAFERMDWLLVRILLSLEIVDACEVRSHVSSSVPIPTNLFADSATTCADIVAIINRLNAFETIPVQPRIQRATAVGRTISTAVVPLKGVAMSFRFDPPELAIAGPLAEPTLRLVERRFVASFRIQAPVRGKPWAAPRFESDPRGHRIVVPASSDESQRLAAILAVLDTLETAYVVQDTHGYSDGDVERLVVLCTPV